MQRKFGSTGVPPVGPPGILPGFFSLRRERDVAPGETPGGRTGRMPVLPIARRDAELTSYERP